MQPGIGSHRSSVRTAAPLDTPISITGVRRVINSRVKVVEEAAVCDGGDARAANAAACLRSVGPFSPLVPRRVFASRREISKCLHRLWYTLRNDVGSD